MVHVDAKDYRKVDQHDTLQQSDVSLGNIWVDKIIVHMEVSHTTMSPAMAVVLIFFVRVTVS